MNNISNVNLNFKNNIPKNRISIDQSIYFSIYKSSSQNKKKHKTLFSLNFIKRNSQSKFNPYQSTNRVSSTIVDSIIQEIKDKIFQKIDQVQAYRFTQNVFDRLIDVDSYLKKNTLKRKTQNNECHNKKENKQLNIIRKQHQPKACIQPNAKLPQTISKHFYNNINLMNSNSNNSNSKYILNKNVKKSKSKEKIKIWNKQNTREKLKKQQNIKKLPSLQINKNKVVCFTQGNQQYEKSDSHNKLIQLTQFQNIESCLDDQNELYQEYQRRKKIRQQCEANINLNLNMGIPSKSRKKRKLNGNLIQDILKSSKTIKLIQQIRIKNKVEQLGFGYDGQAILLKNTKSLNNLNNQNKSLNQKNPKIEVKVRQINNKIGLNKLRMYKKSIIQFNKKRNNEKNNLIRYASLGQQNIINNENLINIGNIQNQIHKVLKIKSGVNIITDKNYFY